MSSVNKQPFYEMLDDPENKKILFNILEVSILSLKYIADKLPEYGVKLDFKQIENEHHRLSIIKNLNPENKDSAFQLADTINSQISRITGKSLDEFAPELLEKTKKHLVNPTNINSTDSKALEFLIRSSEDGPGTKAAMGAMSLFIMMNFFGVKNDLLNENRNTQIS